MVNPSKIIKPDFSKKRTRHIGSGRKGRETTNLENVRKVLLESHTFLNHLIQDLNQNRSPLENIISLHNFIMDLRGENPLVLRLLKIKLERAIKTAFLYRPHLRVANKEIFLDLLELELKLLKKME